MQPSIFMSHNHQDKAFVRLLSQDLSAMGVRVWLDEAEIRIGDSLIEKISSAIDQMQYLGIVMSPSSVASAWVKEELGQALAGQLAARTTKVLPILRADCVLPGFLRGRAYADFRDSVPYEDAFKKLLLAMGVDMTAPEKASLRDPFAKEMSRVDALYARPKSWHCIACGWLCEETFNDYICKRCAAIRPFAGGSATMIICRDCGQLSLAVAAFCEWCGIHLSVTARQPLTYRCGFKSARVLECRFSAGDHVGPNEALVVLVLDNGRRIEVPDLRHGTSRPCVVQEVFVSPGQLLLSGAPIVKVMNTAPEDS